MQIYINMYACTFLNVNLIVYALRACALRAGGARGRRPSIYGEGS